MLYLVQYVAGALFIFRVEVRICAKVSAWQVAA